MHCFWCFQRHIPTAKLQMADPWSVGIKCTWPMKNIGFSGDPLYITTSTPQQQKKTSKNKHTYRNIRSTNLRWAFRSLFHVSNRHIAARLSDFHKQTGKERAGNVAITEHIEGAKGWITQVKTMKPSPNETKALSRKLCSRSLGLSSRVAQDAMVQNIHVSSYFTLFCHTAASAAPLLHSVPALHTLCSRTCAAAPRPETERPCI